LNHPELRPADLNLLSAWDPRDSRSDPAPYRNPGAPVCPVEFRGPAPPVDPRSGFFSTLLREAQGPPVSPVACRSSPFFVPAGGGGGVDRGPRTSRPLQQCHPEDLCGGLRASVRRATGLGCGRWRDRHAQLGHSRAARISLCGWVGFSRPPWVSKMIIGDGGGGGGSAFPYPGISGPLLNPDIGQMRHHPTYLPGGSSRPVTHDPSSPSLGGQPCSHVSS